VFLSDAKNSYASERRCILHSFATVDSASIFWTAPRSEPEPSGVGCTLGREFFAPRDEPLRGRRRAGQRTTAEAGRGIEGGGTLSERKVIFVKSSTVPSPFRGGGMREDVTERRSWKNRTRSLGFFGG